MEEEENEEHHSDASNPPIASQPSTNPEDPPPHPSASNNNENENAEADGDAGISSPKLQESQPSSPVHSPQEIPTPQSYTPRRRRSSLVPPDSELIQMGKRGRSGSRSPRRGSQAFLIGDDTIIMQFDNGKRRLSSFCTTSSNDETIITVDESLTDEEVMETLRAHKQIIANIKTQCWPMNRKMKVLRRAKLYIKKHEGDLKQSKQAKDIVATYRAFLEKSINRLKREIDNLIVQLTPWEMRIKKIESQFGSVVASYFIFLRWVFWVNTFISVFICCFLMVPEILRGPQDLTGMRKEVEDKTHALDLKTIWEFDGYLKYSPIFYGYYSNEPETTEGYRLPLAYFLTSIILYMFSFFVILRKMAQNARQSRVSTKDDDYVFTWKLFTGWDYMIGNSETAYNKASSIAMGFKEVILEEKERSKVEKSWKLILRRILANILVLTLLASSSYAVYLVVDRSQHLPPEPGWIRENEVTLVMSGIGNLYPNLFNIIAILEDNHPRIQLRWQLARILVLNLLNLYTLMLSSFVKIDDTTKKLTSVKTNLTMEKAERLGIEMDVESMFTSVSVRVKRHDGRYKPPSCESCVDPISTGISYNERKPVNIGYNNEVTTVPSYPHKPVTNYEEPIEGRYYERNHYEWTNGRPRQTPKVTTITPDGYTVTSTVISTKISTVTSSPSVTTKKSISSVTSPVTSTAKDERISTVDTKKPVVITTPTVTKQTTTTTVSTVTSSKLMTSSTTMSSMVISTKKPIQTKVTVTPTTTITTPIVTTVISSVSTTATLQVTTTEKAKIKLPDCETKNTTLITIGSDDLINITDTVRSKLRTLCWETNFGQELTKLTVMDLVMAAVASIIGDFLRAVIVRYCNHRCCFFWDLEKKFPGYGDFQIAENILHLVNNQGQVWLGMFFSPGLPAINTIKLCVLMYLRSWAVLSCNIPHETVFKASGSNNFYYALLLLMLFICTLPVGYAIVWLEPSWHCGPFSDYERIYHVFTKYIEDKLPNTFNRIIDYLTSPGAVIPLIMLLVLIIYYLVASLGSLRDQNSDLKQQLRREKDLPELADQKQTDHPATNGTSTPAPEKKHVRIAEEVTTSDKAKLLGSESP